MIRSATLHEPVAMAADQRRERVGIAAAGGRRTSSWSESADGSGASARLGCGGRLGRSAGGGFRVPALGHLQHLDLVDSASVAAPLLRQRGQIHQHEPGRRRLLQGRSVAVPPACDRVLTVRHWASLLIGGLVVPAGSVLGIRACRSVPLPLSWTWTVLGPVGDAPRSRTSPTPRLMPPRSGSLR